MSPMNNSKNLPLWVSSLVFAYCILVSSAVAAEQLSGRWQGSATIGSNTVEIGAGFRSRQGVIIGKLDMQGLGSIALQKLSYQASTLTFEFDSPLGVISVEASRAGDSITGTLTAANGSGPLILNRVEPMAVDGFIDSYMAEQHIPGLAAAIVRDGEIVWRGTYGYADVANKIPVTTDTIFMLASVSKTLAATSLMMLHQAGKFALDEDVNNYLPFAVRNPNHPEQPITFGQLLKHRSSIKDDLAFYGPLWSTANGDPKTVLGEYLASYLQPGGNQYSKENNFYPYAPGEQYNYCNTCFALIGYLAERISGKPFKNYHREVLLEPLGMQASGWFYADVEAEKVALPYRYDDKEGFVSYGVAGYPDWPAGQLRASLTDIARFLAAYTQYGKIDGKQVFDPAVVKRMTPDDMAEGFYTWFASSMESTTDILYSHGGGDIGARTLIAFNRKTREGLVVLTNSDYSPQPVAAELYEAMPTLGWE